MFDRDEDKRQTNLARHGVDFGEAERFDWDTATARLDARHDYGEERIKATGLIGDRIHVLIYTVRGADRRVISLRKANQREVREWLT